MEPWGQLTEFSYLVYMRGYFGREYIYNYDQLEV